MPIIPPTANLAQEQCVWMPLIKIGLSEPMRESNAKVRSIITTIMSRSWPFHSATMQDISVPNVSLSEVPREQRQNAKPAN